MDTLPFVAEEGDVIPQDEVESVTSHVPFGRLVELFQCLASSTGKNDRLRILSEFWAEMKTVVAKVTGEPGQPCTGDTFPSHALPPTVAFALLRLLSPIVDRRRPAYGLKERALADAYCDVLMLDKNSSSTYFNLKNFKVPERYSGKTRDSAGDFPTVLEENLRGHAAKKGTLSVADINSMLAIIGSNRALQASAAEKKHMKKQIFSTLTAQATATENAWFVRLVLKHMQMGIKEKTLFDWFHRDAHEFYKSRTDLHLLCVRAHDPQFAVHERPPKICLGQPGQLQMSQRAPHDLQVLVDGLRGAKNNFYFYMEPKFDGERLQLHKHGTSLTCFTRNGFNSDYLWLEVLKDPILSTFRDVYACVLDGEVVTWDERHQKFLDPNESRSWAVERQKKLDLGEADDERNLLYKVQFQIFDVIFWQLKENQEGSGAKVVELTYENRRKVLQGFLHKKYFPREGQYALQLPISEKGHTALDIMQTLDTYLEKKYEGVMIKNPFAQYHMGSREILISAKLKPDFLEGGMSDLDLTVLAGYYSSGRKSGRAGRLSHFLLGVRRSSQPGVFIPVGRVGTGYSVHQLDQITEKTHNKWFEHESVPPYIYSPPTGSNTNAQSRLKHKPDRWINPDDSFVFVVRAFSLIKDPVNGYSLRFPRVTKLHVDKRPSETLSLEDLIKINREKDINRVARHEVAKKQKREVETLTQPPAKQVRCNSRVTQLFKGMEMAIFADRVRDTKKSAEILELISAHGGRPVKAGNTNPTKTQRIIRISDHAEKGRSKYIQEANENNTACTVVMVKPEWVWDCLSLKTLLPVSSKYLIWAPQHLRGSLEHEEKEFQMQYTSSQGVSKEDFLGRFIQSGLDPVFLSRPEETLHEITARMPRDTLNSVFGDRAFVGLKIRTPRPSDKYDVVLRCLLLVHGAQFTEDSAAKKLGDLSLDWANGCIQAGMYTLPP